MATRLKLEGLVKKVRSIALSAEGAFRSGAVSTAKSSHGVSEESQRHSVKTLPQIRGLASGVDSQKSLWNGGRIAQSVIPSRLLHGCRVNSALQAADARNVRAEVGVIDSEGGDTGDAAEYTYRDDKLIGRRGTYNRSDCLSYLHARQRNAVRKLVNICMVDGKKATSRGIVYKALTKLSQHGDVVAILDRALENVKPMCEVKKVRKAGTTQLVPCIIARNRQETLAMRWILEAAVKQRGAKKSMGLDQCLAAELLDASQKTGGARKKRDELHKLAEANRGSSHFRWW